LVDRGGVDQAVWAEHDPAARFRDTRWAEADVTRLRAELDRIDPGSIHAQAHAALISAVSGDRSRAGTQIARLLEVPACRSAQLAYWDRHAIGNAVFHALDLDLLGRLLGAWSEADATVWVGLRPASAIPVDPWIASWELDGRGASSFLFHPAILSSARLRHCIPRFVDAVPLFTEIVRRNPSVRGRVAVTLADVATFPGLGFSANDPAVCLLPDHEFVRSRGYETFKFESSSAQPPWRDRMRAALWRGSAYGPLAAGFRALQRVRLCEAALGSELLDAGLTSGGDFPPDDQAAMQSAGLFRAPVPAVQQSQWKYLIDVDGYSNSWAGLFQKLYSASTVIKIASPAGYRQWYYERLRPWENYVPVEADLSDMVDKVNWLRAHDDEAQRIGKRGRNLALSMTFETELRYAEAAVIDRFTRDAGGPRRS